MECTLGKESPELKELKQLSNTLPTLKALLVDKSPGRASYRVKNIKGEYSVAIAKTLLSEPGVAIVRLKMAKGDEMENHLHSENEWVIVISGSFKTIINDVEEIVKPGGYIYYPPESGHSGTVIEDLDCICITVPKAEGYPDAN